VLDNSIYALQKRVLNSGFKACLNVALKTENNNAFVILVSDNGGGLSKDKISNIYRMSIESSKGGRLGEGTMIVKNFIEGLGGYVTGKNIKTNDDIGLETTIRLPCFLVN
jgi:sensor histidine kinase regulating citrate/malate metabolism